MVKSVLDKSKVMKQILVVISMKENPIFVQSGEYVMLCYVMLCYVML